MFINSPIKVSTFGFIRLRATHRTIALIILFPPAPMASLIIAGLRIPADTRHRRSANISNACGYCQGTQMSEVRGEMPAARAPAKFGIRAPAHLRIRPLVLRVMDSRELNDFETSFPGGRADLD